MTKQNAILNSLTPLSHSWQVLLLGDHAIQFYLEPIIDSNIIIEIKKLHQFIATQNLHFVKEIIPAYNSLTLVYDIPKLNGYLQNNSPQIDILQWSNIILQNFQKTKKNNEEITGSKLVRIPVCYDPLLGIDLQNIALSKKCSIESIITTHTNTVYDVFCLGFMPGFAYMGKVDPTIQMPRHDKPRTSVAAGSVGIAGQQTGIYPSNSPGGWQIIGRTPLRIFDPIQLAKFKVGDRVQFYEITYENYLANNEN